MDPTNFYTLPNGIIYKKFDVEQCLRNQEKWHTRPRKDYPHGDSPLMYACRTSQKAVTLFLLSKMDKYRFGAPKINDDKQSIIHIACENGDPDIIKVVVEHCAMSENALHAVDKDGMTPLAILVKKANKVGVTVFQLFRRDLIVPPNLNNTKDPLVMASKLQDPTILQILLARKATRYDKYSSFQTILNQPETAGFTTCFQESASLEDKCLAAIRLNQPHLLRLILLNTKWTIPTSILKMVDENSEIASVLIEYGVRAEDLQKYSHTQNNNPYAAASNNFPAGSQAQAAQSVSTNNQSANQEKYEKLFTAIKYSTSSDLDYFTSVFDSLKKEADFNLYTMNQDGQTFLHAAMDHYCSVKIAVKLILDGFKMETPDRDGKTVIERALEKSRTNEKTFLEEISLYSKSVFSQEDLNVNFEKQLSRKEFSYSQELAYYFFCKGAVPTQKCYDLAIANQYFWLANVMLSSGIIPVPGSFSGVRLQEIFALRWLSCIKDPLIRFKEALRVGYGNVTAFSNLSASNVAVSQKFVAACQMGATVPVTEFLKQNIALNNEEKLLVLKAACVNVVELAQILVEKRIIDLNFCDEQLNTAFHLTVNANNSKVLRYFCSFDKSGIEKLNSANLTPLQLAIQKNKIDCISVLWEFGSKVPDLPQLKDIWDKTQNYDFNNKVQIFKKAPKEIMLFAFRRFEFKDLYEILQQHTSSIELDQNEIREMLSIVLEQKSFVGLSILTNRLLNRHPNDFQGLIDSLTEKDINFALECLPTLVGLGVKIEKERTLESLWQHLCAKGQSSIAIKYLSLFVLNRDGFRSPLHITAKVGDIEGLVQLLGLKAWNINQRNALGETAFLNLIQSESFLNGQLNIEAVFQLFLNAGADVKIPNAQGETAFKVFFHSFWKSYIQDFEKNWSGRNLKSSGWGGGNSFKKDACIEQWQSKYEEKFKDYVYQFKKLGFDGKDVLKYMNETKWIEQVELYTIGGTYSVSGPDRYIGGGLYQKTTQTITTHGGMTGSSEVKSPLKELIPNSYKLLKS